MKILDITQVQTCQCNHQCQLQECSHPASFCIMSTTGACNLLHLVQSKTSCISQMDWDFHKQHNIHRELLLNSLQLHNQVPPTCHQFIPEEELKERRSKELQGRKQQQQHMMVKKLTVLACLIHSSWKSPPFPPLAY